MRFRKEQGATSRASFIALLVVAVVVIIASCSNVDCPFMNSVYTTYQIKDLEGKTDTLKDTLTVSIRKYNGVDTILLNKAVQKTSFDLPISYIAPADTFFFHRYGDEMRVTDTVTVEKTNTPHFESVDCAPKYFHDITNVHFTQHGIEHIEIMKRKVTYEPQDHFYIVFKH
ncbi:MAG: DUF6452 family protein [Prevotella sp.]|nr:DUF6452 family protein [Prevotella sp.]